jgi:redox-sensitive bicupin YhaK (pirin superfamily)
MELIPATHTLEGAGISVYRTIGTMRLDHLDPFLLLDDFREPNPAQSPGLPWHPHRGFETVTYMITGEVEHRDRIGGHGHLHTGDIQWMTAGRGIIHQEMPVKTSAPVRGIQLWVNLPGHLKMIAPRYQDCASADIPEVQDEGWKVRVIAGDFQGQSGAADTHLPITYLDIHLEAHASIEIPIPEDHHCLAYILTGEGHFEPDGALTQETTMVRFGLTGPVMASSATGMRFLLIAGAPLNEPIARYGPFVMNTRDELVTAFRDYESGQLM